MPKITEIEEIKKYYYKIYADGGFLFCLYKSDISKLKIKLDLVISEYEIESIKNEIVYKRARERALYLIEKKEKTENELRNKLKDGFYTDDIIDKVIEMLKSYGYIDDFDYAIRYIKYKSESKSIKAIKNDLYLKKIDKDIIDRAVDELQCDERNLIFKLIEKKYKNIDLTNYQNKSKAIRYLMSKGFNYDDITSEIESYININS